MLLAPCLTFLFLLLFRNFQPFCIAVRACDETHESSCLFLLFPLSFHSLPLLWSRSPRLLLFKVVSNSLEPDSPRKDSGTLCKIPIWIIVRSLHLPRLNTMSSMNGPALAAVSPLMDLITYTIGLQRA